MSDRRRESEKCRWPWLSPLVEPVRPACPCDACPLPCVSPRDLECNYRPFLAIGLFCLLVLKKVLMPFTSGVSLIPVVHAAKKSEQNCDPNRNLVRANDLPLYPDEKQCKHCIEAKNAAECKDKNILEETIACAREELWLLADQTKVIKGELAQVLGTAIDHAGMTLNILREEENVVPRAGAIALGGLAGVAYALRKGLFKKLFYGGLGAGGMAALAYPNEAKEYSAEGFKHVKRYALIGYHFMNGVSRDVLGWELPWPSHLVVSDSAHPPADSVPSPQHLLPPEITPTHIPLPGEQQ